MPTRARHCRAYRHGTLLLGGMTIRIGARLCNEGCGRAVAVAQAPAP
ncbi:hypothetical protein SFR_6139 [Streptomyces sp. FR-008]|nr:hypothetical protein SFR_6139 [Streptomyces sp. FR-008]